MLRLVVDARHPVFFAVRIILVLLKLAEREKLHGGSPSERARVTASPVRRLDFSRLAKRSGSPSVATVTEKQKQGVLLLIRATQALYDTVGAHSPAPSVHITWWCARQTPEPKASGRGPMAAAACCRSSSG